MSGGNGELPAGWEVAALPDVCDVIMGQSPPSSTYRNDPDGLPFFQGKAEFGELHPTVRKWCAEPNKIAEPDDILLSIRAPVGPTNVANKRCCIGRGLAALRPTKLVDGRYVLFSLRHLETKLARLATGTTFKAVSGRVLSTFELCIPPLPEQRRIVAKIEALQERSRKAREALAEVKPLLEQFRQSLLAAAFRGDLTADWREQNPDVEPASALLQRIRTERRRRWEEAELAKYEAKSQKPPRGWQDKYKEPEPVDNLELPELPEGWCWCRVGDLIESIDAGRSPTALSHPARNGEPGVLKVSAVTWREFDPTANKALKHGDEIGDTPTPRRGDLLISRANTVELIGAVVLVKADFPNLMLSDKTLRLNPASADIPQQYMLYGLRSPSVRDSFEANATGTSNSMRNLSQAKILEATIALSPLAEQHEIVRRMQALMGSESELRSVVPTLEASLTHLDQSILAKAFRGELVPQDPNNEPASVLLERIRQQREATSPKRGRKKVDPAARATTAEQAQRAALLDFVQQQPGLADHQYIDATVLAMQSARCRALLIDEDQKRFDRVLPSLPPELIADPNAEPSWISLTKDLLVRRALRREDGLLALGDSFDEVRASLPRIPKEFLALVAKAMKRYREHDPPKPKRRQRKQQKEDANTT
ncbi:Type-1 restriction enzyme EcoKI specificity protein [Planctomycetes bacterium Pan216]|uniref:Type-1 restriction enzyme EcoKI specificity protein n=1 Tax=Kolteria novifilia TaxID=2527975 RepID=A0A518AXY3_9BACT|nr:Type-1 restriction enzyme EcoKI specificity protein [Planctomycetes bacterium Pan216]